MIFLNQFAFEVIKEAIDLLKRNNIKSISFQDWKNLNDENITYYKQIKNLYG